MNFSVLDGWWIEGCLEGHTGWAIGPEPETEDDMKGYDESLDAEDLSGSCNQDTAALLQQHQKWIRMMKLGNFDRRELLQHAQGRQGVLRKLTERFQVFEYDRL